MHDDARLVIGEVMANEELPNIGVDGKIDTRDELPLCPHCGSDDTSVDHIEYEYNHVYKYFVCDACGAKWVEDYVFDGAYTIN